jgi:hypothetical protein
MNEWHSAFLRRLESARKQWLQRFEVFASEQIEPVFERYAEFTRQHEFRVSTPDCERGTRLFKFALTENGYVLFTFRMRGLEEVEVCTEVFVPGPEGVEPETDQASVANVDEAWIELLFQSGLDRFIIAFGAASVGDPADSDELIMV